VLVSIPINSYNTLYLDNINNKSRKFLYFIALMDESILFYDNCTQNVHKTCGVIQNIPDSRLIL